MSTTNTQITAESDEVLLDVYPRALKRGFVSGKGSTLIDVEGKEYIDFSSGLGVNVLGICDEQWTKCVSDQLARGAHCSNLFYHEPQLTLAKKLSKLTKLSLAYFSNSGAEANESAIKIARRWGSTQNITKSRIICFEQGWHGRTLGTISANADSSMKRGFEPLLPGFDPVPMFELCAIESAIRPDTAAVLIEPVIGHGGIHAAPREFLRGLRSLCDEKGILLMFDEIQTGGGRCGTFLYCDRFDVQPDILSLGKGLAGGFPIGATLCTRDAGQHMDKGSHGSTFGGNPLACSAGLATVERTSDPDFLSTVTKKSEALASRLRMLTSKYPFLGEVRTIGMLMGIDVSHSAKPLTACLAEAGLISTALGQHCLRFMPALTISDGEISRGLDALQQGFELAKTTIYTQEGEDQ